jgi:hypothetical protein
MRISTPLTSRARKAKVVIQWVTRTTAECRDGTAVAGTAEAEVRRQTESAICGIVSLAHTVRSRRGRRDDGVPRGPGVRPTKGGQLHSVPFR